MNFLARPAVDRPWVASDDPAKDAGGFAPTNGSHNALTVLQPSGNPGSLGRLARYEVLEVLGQGPLISRMLARTGPASPLSDETSSPPSTPS